jgi:nucleoid-associated protein YgaU
MGMTSAAEAKLDARVRPDIAAMQARTPYPRRRPAGADPSATAARPATAAALAPVVPLRPAAGPAAKTEVQAGTWAAGTGEQVKVAAPVKVAAKGRTPIRLTRRGRIVVSVLALLGAAAVACLIWLTVGGQAEAASQIKPGPPLGNSVQRVVVRPGQTLWGIATAVDPSADPRTVIPEIVDLNSLAGTGISAGQVLWIPKS